MEPTRATAIRRALLGALLAVCVLGRGAYAVYLAHDDPSSTASGDTKSYVQPAMALLRDGRFNHNVGPTDPEFIRTPGYPVFIAGVYKVFGVDLTALLLAQVALSACTLLVVYLLASRMWSPWVGLAAAACTLLDPSQNLASVKVLTECVATLLLVLTAWAGWKTFERERPPVAWAAGLGLALAVATMVRPVTYYLPLLVLALFGYRFVRTPAARRRVAAAALAFMVPVVALVGGWQLRNHRTVDSWRLSAVEAKNLYAYRAAAVLADVHGTAILDNEHQLHRDLVREPGETLGSYYGRMYERAAHILEAHPVSTAKVTLLGLANEVVGVRLTLHGLHAMWIDPLALGALYLTYLVGAFGVVAAWRRGRHRAAHALMVAIVLYVIVVSAGPEAYGGRGERFRAPVMPIVVVYAAFGAFELVERFRKRRGTARELTA